MVTRLKQREPVEIVGWMRQTNLEHCYKLLPLSQNPDRHYRSLCGSHTIAQFDGVLDWEFRSHSFWPQNVCLKCQAKMIELTPRCPILEELWALRERRIVNYQMRADLKKYCAICERRLPEDCPEVCVMCRQLPVSLSGGCELECGCMQPPDDALREVLRKRGAEFDLQARITSRRRKKPLDDTTNYDPDHPSIIA